MKKNNKNAFKTVQGNFISKGAPKELKLIVKEVYDGMTKFEQDFIDKGGDDGVRAVFEVLPKIHASVEKMIAFSGEHGDLDDDLDLAVRTIAMEYQNAVNYMRKFAATGDCTTDEAKKYFFLTDQSIIAVRQAAKQIL